MEEIPVNAGPEGWSGRVAYSEGAGESFAYRPGELIGRDLPGSPLGSALEQLGVTILDESASDDGFRWFEIDTDDVLAVIEDLRDEGFQVEPNYVLFTHAMAGNPLYGNPLYGNPLYGNPLYGNPLYGNPLYGNPLYGNPLYGNPLYGNPLYGNPLYGNPLCGGSTDGNPYRQTGLRPSSARPADARGSRAFTWSHQLPKVVIVDTGIAAQGPAKSAAMRNLAAASSANLDEPDQDGDSDLDPIAGHGTFIAGLLDLLAPGCTLEVVRAIRTSEGDISEWELKGFLDAILPSCDSRTIVNLSMGGYAANRGMRAVARSIRAIQKRGAVVVASAGNDGIPREIYPACLKDVVSVGALGPCGPAAFSNYGPWVRACAPGFELVSTFFDNFNGPRTAILDHRDPDHFEGWARWSGTSFAAPVVVAALAREMGMTGCDAKTAVENAVDAPGLARLPGLGTIVNIA